MDPRTEAINAEVSRQAAEAESRHAAICERLGPMSSSVWPYVVRPHVERQARERAAWARLVKAERAEWDADVTLQNSYEGIGEMGTDEALAAMRKAQADTAIALQALRDLGVDVDALLKEP